jgi:hypothetical protein
MVVLVAAAAMPFPEVQETLQQRPHHKEILVERALARHLTTLAAEVVQVVLAQQVRQLSLVMVVQDHPHL